MPICLASLYAFQDEYSQKGCAMRLAISHRSGCFNPVMANHAIVSVGKAICTIVFQNVFFFMVVSYVVK